MPVGRGRGRRVALWGVAVLVVLLVASQFLLPLLAARVVRQRLGRYGPVHSVSVHAFPALELLWGQAQSFTVRAGELRLTPAQAGDLLWGARGVDSTDVFATSLLVGPLRLRGVHMTKRGSAVRVQGMFTLADLRAALPTGVSLQGISRDAQGQLEVTVGGGLFGVNVSVVAVIEPSQGALVAQPRGFSFGGLGRITLFSDPHLAVQAVALTPLPGPAQSWRLDLRGALH